MAMITVTVTTSRHCVAKYSADMAVANVTTVDADK